MEHAVGRRLDSRAIQVGKGKTGATATEAQRAAKHLWFANLNTPEEFAEAESIWMRWILRRVSGTMG